MNGIVSSSSFKLSNCSFEKAFQSRRKWPFNLGEKWPSTLRLPLVGSLDLTVGWCSFRDMLFTAAWALHPPLGFIVRGSSHRKSPWRKGHRGVGMGVWVDSVSLSDGHATSASVNGM
ncbi:hypothetical protein GQ457_10G010880 [Hibiscus cannabinus]